MFTKINLIDIFFIQSILFGLGAPKDGKGHGQVKGLAGNIMVKEVGEGAGKGYKLRGTQRTHHSQHHDRLDRMAVVESE